MRKAVVILLSLLLVLGLSSIAAAGEYTGYSQADEHGYVEARVRLEDSEILSVELTEYTDTGEPKGEDYPWEEFHEAMEVLPEKFAAADDYDVDTVSGATSTIEKAREAVRMALEKAEGITEFDGTYMGVSDPSDRDAWGVAWVTVEDGEILEVRVEEVSDGEFKDEDYQWDEFHEAKEEIPARITEANNPEVDVYSGATGSSERWMQAVERALLKAGWDL